MSNYSYPELKLKIWKSIIKDKKSTCMIYNLRHKIKKIHRSPDCGHNNSRGSGKTVCTMNITNLYLFYIFLNMPYLLMLGSIPQKVN